MRKYLLAILIATIGAFALIPMQSASADHDNYNWHFYSPSFHTDINPVANSMTLKLYDGLCDIGFTPMYAYYQLSIQNARPGAHTARLQIRARHPAEELIAEIVTPQIQPGNTYTWTNPDGDDVFRSANGETYARAKWGDSSNWYEADLFYNSGADTNEWYGTPTC